MLPCFDLALRRQARRIQAKSFRKRPALAFRLELPQCFCRSKPHQLMIGFRRARLYYDLGQKERATLAVISQLAGGKNELICDTDGRTDQDVKTAFLTGLADGGLFR